MADDILFREKEFLKLNDELDKKTKSIIEKTDKTITKHLRVSPRKTAMSPRNNDKYVNDLEVVAGAIQAVNCFQKLQKTPYKSNTIPRPLRDNLTTRKIHRDKKLINTDLCNNNGPSKLSQTVHNTNNNPEISRNRSMKSLNRKTNAMLTETFRNEKFSDSFSVENLTDKNGRKQAETDENEIENCIVKNASDQVSAASEKVDNLPPDSGNNCKTVREIFETSTAKNSVAADQGSGKKNISSDGLIKFLKSKISILQDELSNSTHLLAKRCKELENGVETQKKLEHQRDQAMFKNNALTEQLSKIEKDYQMSKVEFRENEQLLTAANREVEDLKRDLKIAKQSNINLEKRLYRANEETENLKNNLSIVKSNERESREMIRVDRETQEKKLRSLKKQRSDLLTAYKKQIYLVDNLKRQNACMEQARLISFGEKEFNKVLEWNMKN